MHGTIADLITSYGYVVLFLLVGIESFGVPLPGETALVTAAAFAALGRLHIALVVIVAATGAIVGDNAGYWLGRWGGIAVVRRYGRHVGLDQTKLERAHAFFQRHGAKTVFIGRFIALLRSWAAALAGVGCMPYGTFMAYNALGGVTWAALFGTLGYMFGRNLPRLERHLGQASLALALLATLGVLIAIIAHQFHANRERIAASLAARWNRIAESPRLAAFRTRHPRFWSFVAARFARGEYLGIHLTLGLFVSLVALWGFAGVTEDVLHHDPLTVVDLQLATWMRAHASPGGDRIAMIVSAVGSPVAMAALAGIVAAVLAYRRWWVVLAGWSAAYAGGSLLDQALKNVIRRPRPYGAEAFLYGTSFSFPSGHAMGSLIGYGMSAYLLIAFWPRAQRHWITVTLGAALLVVLVGTSRLYLGVHYLSDVMGGYAAGIVWLATCATGVEIARRWQPSSDRSI